MEKKYFNELNFSLWKLAAQTENSIPAKTIIGLILFKKKTVKAATITIY